MSSKDAVRRTEKPMLRWVFLLLALLGIAIGLVGAFFLTGLMSKLLFGVTPTDAVTFASVAAILWAT